MRYRYLRAQLKNASLEIAALTASLHLRTCACKDTASITPSTRRRISDFSLAETRPAQRHPSARLRSNRTTTIPEMPDAEAIRRRFDRIPEEPKTAEDHPWIAAALLFVFVFFFISVLSTFLNSSAQYQKELAAAEARKKAKKDE